MTEYPKIQTVFRRDPNNRFRTLLDGDFAIPEFDYLKNNRWVFTEKIDGTNIRVVWQDGKVTFMGKTDNAQIPALLITKLQEHFTVEKMKVAFPDSTACLYGEGYGARIQKSGGNYIADGVDFILFDIRIDKWWLERKNVEDVATKLSIGIVPIVGEGTLLDAVDMARSGYLSQIGSQMAEGVVMRPVVELASRNGHRIISKIKHKDFVPKGK